MKKLILSMMAVSFGIALSSCYRHTTCATYTKVDKKIEIQEKGLEQDENL